MVYIEPCKLEVKAVAPIRRFNALKELIASSDKLLNELKTKVYDNNCDTFAGCVLLIWVVISLSCLFKL